MPLASEAKAPTYSWIQRTSQLTEFAMLKESVKKLERASREQLLLENESQGAFDHLSTEVSTLKEAIGTLSRVVDGEMAEMRKELQQIREEMRGCVTEARSEADTASQKVADATRSAQALVELSVQTVKENLHRVEQELREARASHSDLAMQHSAAVARLDASHEAAKQEASHFLEALAQRVSAGEAQSGAIQAELDQRLRHEHNGLMSWAEEARGALASLRTDTNAAMALGERTSGRCTQLEAASRSTDAALQETNAEGARHLSAIELLVSSLDKASAESKENCEQIGGRVADLEQLVQAGQAAHSLLATSTEAEHERLREATQQLETSTSALREDANVAKLTLSRHSDQLRSLETDLGGLRRESAETASGMRALKSGLKDAVDRQKASEQKVRKQLDAIDVRHEGYDDAIASFADALKLANPLAEGLGRAAAAL
jgi:chromosome segregation ATPase